MAEPPTLKERLNTCLGKQAEYDTEIKDLKTKIKTLEDAGKDATLLRDDKKSAEKGLADEKITEHDLNNLLAIEAQALEAEKEREFKILLNSPASDNLTSAWKDNAIHSDPNIGGTEPADYLIPLWRCIVDDKIVKTENFWKLPDSNAKWIGKLNDLFIRTAYNTTSSNILDSSIKLCLITGLKGIGKTAYLNHLIVKIVEKHRASGSIPIIILCQNMGGGVIRYTRLDKNGVHIVAGASKDVQYYLSDSVDIPTPDLSNCLYVEVASENTANYLKFHDRIQEEKDNSVELVMDVWDYTELLKLRPTDAEGKVFSPKEAEFLFDVFGGVARCFGRPNTLKVVTHNYVEECMEFYFDPLIKINYLHTWNYALNEIQFRIKAKKLGDNNPDIALMSGLFWNPRTEDFTSNFMKVLAGQTEKKDPSLWSAINKLCGSSGEGVAYESVGHQTLIKTDYNYVARNINPNVRKNKLCTRKFFKMPRMLFRTEGGIKLIPNDTYGLPTKSNFPIIDSIVQPDILLQFTIAETHGKDTDDYDSIRNQLRNTNRDQHKLVFVIPQENFETFQPIGVPKDLSCFYMHYVPIVDVADAKIHRKRPIALVNTATTKKSKSNK